MGVVRIELPDDVKTLMDQQVAAGRAASEAAYVVEALRLYADHLEAEDEIAVLVERADADLAAGRYVTITTPDERDALHRRTMERVAVRLASDPSPG